MQRGAAVHQPRHRLLRQASFNDRTGRWHRGIELGDACSGPSPVDQFVFFESDVSADVVGRNPTGIDQRQQFDFVDAEVATSLRWGEHRSSWNVWFVHSPQHQALLPSMFSPRIRL